MTTKFTYNSVKQIIENEGYKLLSTEYINSGSKIDLLCPKNHSYQVTLNNFISKKHRCKNCSNKSIHTIDSIKELLEKEGYTLTTTKYQNMHQKLEMVCPKGHIYATSLTNYIGNGCRCFICSGIKRYNIEEIQDILKKEGYRLITSIYKNAHEKLEMVCPKGHTINIAMNWFLSQKSRCRFCAPNRPHTLESIAEFVEKRGYKLISESYDPNGKISLICPNNHLYDTSTFYNFKKGRTCPECNEKGTSKAEQEMLSWINQFYPHAEKEKLYYDKHNGKKFLEIDIYIPELKLGIEYNGLIWHCQKFKEDTQFHINKMRLANEQGIRLLNIFGDEWRDRKDQIKNYLLSVMGKNPTTIGARKTEIRVVSKKEAKSFLEENHIQGEARLQIAFGLYYKNELIGIMTGDKHHRQGQENVFVLNRLAFKTGISVQGGSSKLLKALICYTKQEGYSKLISWSDNRWSEGKVYEKMGFTLEEEMNPDYSYVKREDRISKQSCQKKHLIKRGAKGTMSNTEKELALSLGLYRIYDCGKKRWVMNLA